MFNACHLPPPPSAVAPDFSQNLLKTHTMVREGGDVLIECRPKMSPRGLISWRKGAEALRETSRYVSLGAPMAVRQPVGQSLAGSTAG